MSDAPDWKPETLSTVEWADLSIGGRLDVCTQHRERGEWTCILCGAHGPMPDFSDHARNCPGDPHERAEEPQS